MKYRLRLLKMGQCEVPSPEVYWMSGWQTWEMLHFWMVVIQGGGKTVVINTGPPADLAPLNEAWKKAIDPRAQMIRKEDERPEKALATIGVLPSGVGHVLITPLQAYATGNIPLFRNATICISRRGWIEDFHAPKYEMHIPRKLRIPDDVLTYLEIQAPEKMRLLDDEDEILPGIRAFWTGVHHRSSMAYLIETEAGTIAVSDCFFKYRNLDEMIPLGIMESMEECIKAYTRIKRESHLWLPLYDPLVPDRLGKHLKSS